MWTNLRAELEKIRNVFSLTDKQFAPVNLNEWQNIQELIIKRFCNTTYRGNVSTWLWESFKQDTYSVQLEKPGDLLSKLVDNKEQVWFFVNETVNEKNKFWFYTGLIESIQAVINEACHVDEVYFVSKKYLWLICINHHGFLIATGAEMPEKLRHVVNLS